MADRASTRRTSTTSSSSARAAPGCARPSRRAAQGVSVGARSASRSSARPTPSWPRAASPRPWATSGRRTTGRSTSATPCAAARCSTTGAWPSSTPRRRPSACWSWSEWGALFDRTKDGLISQRDFGGHRYARLAHVGDRTGLEMIRTLQHHGVHQGIDVYMECNDPAPAQGRRPGGRRLRLLARDRRVRRSSRPRRSCWPPAASARRGSSPRTPGSTPATASRWRCGAGADLIDMEFIQFHPTGMVWPPVVRGILVTEGVRGDGGTLKNTKGERFMFNYIPEFFKGETADNEEEADALVRRQEEQPPHARPAAARRGRARHQLRGEGGPGHARTAASSSTSPRAAPPTTSGSACPSMYHQFKELADVDITKEPMEVGPTCHYIMGGVRVDADTHGGHGARPLRGRRGAPAACTAPTASAATRSPTSWSSAGAPG